MALSIGTPGRQASSASSPDLSNYVDRTSAQNIAGNKTTSGLWTFTAPYSTGQATFGQNNQAGLINFLNGSNGGLSLTLGYLNATSSQGVLSSTSPAGLVLRNTSTTGYVGIESTGASGYLNFISANTQTMRMQNGRTIIGTGTTDNAAWLLQVQGTARINGLVSLDTGLNSGTWTNNQGISPDVNGTRVIGAPNLKYSVIYSDQFLGSGNNGYFGIATTGHGVYFRQGNATQLTGGFHATTGNYFLQASGAAPADSGERLQVAGTSKFTGLSTFTDTFANGQASFGSLGQGGKISLIEGTSGTAAFTISYFNSTSLGAIIQGNSSSGLVVRNTGSTGYVGLEATGASGIINFISGNSQSMRLFSNGNLRIGASAVDSGNKLQVDGNSGFSGGVTVAGNIVPATNIIYDLGSSVVNFQNVRANTLESNNFLTLAKPVGQNLIFKNATANSTFGVSFLTTGNWALQSPSTTPTDDLSGLQLKHSITASAGIARGMNITSTLTSSSSGDVLVGLDINPTIVNGGSHGALTPVPLRVMGVITGAGTGEGIRITRPGFPSQFLSINESDGVVHNLTGNNNKVFQISATGGTGAHVSLLSNGIERLRVEGSGPVMIQNGGTFTNSGEQLQVVGSSKLDGAVRSTGLQTLSSSSAGLRLFNTSDETTNTEFGTMGWFGNVFTIATNKSGTGSIRDMMLFSTGNMIFNTGSTIRMVFTSTSETGGINIGYNTSLAGAVIGNNSTLNGASILQKIFSLTPTINQSGTAGYTGYYASVYEQATGSGAKNLIDVGTNSAANNGGTHTSRFSVSNIGKVNSVDDFETTVIGKGFILKSPDGTRYRISVDNAGIVTAVAA